MPSTYTDNLGIEKIANGEQSGTWGDTTNLNFDILDQAVNGVVSVTLASAGSSGSPNTLPITDGALSNGRAKFIEFVDGGDLGATAYVQLTPNDAEKIVFVRNSLSGSRSVILFQGTYDAGRDLELAAGVDMIIKFEGAGSVSTVENVSQNFRVEALQVNGNIVVGGTVDGRNVLLDGLKLDGIEPLADVTDTANVTAAGALMDSELANEAAVKAINQQLTTTSSPTFAAATVNGNITVTGTVDGRDIATDGTKLDTIETNADVTDTANVTAAGALMDSELANEAAVKAINQQLTTTSNVTFNTITASGNVEVEGNIHSPANNDQLIIYGGSNNDGAHLELYGSTAGNSNFAVVDADDIRFRPQDGSTNWLKITSSLADLNVPLDVSGDLTVDSDTLHVDSANNRVGIGTTSPSAPLDIATTGYVKLLIDDGANTPFSVGTGANGISIENNTAANNTDEYITLFATDSSIRLGTSGSEAVRISSAGNVGIGTTSPSATLDVVGIAGSDVPLRLYSSDTNCAVSLNDNSTTDTFSVNVKAVGNNMRLRTGGSDNVTITSAGNVGIGTTSPSEKLDVVGNAEINGNITTTGDLEVEGNIYSPADTDALRISGGSDGNGAHLVLYGSGSGVPSNAIMDADVHRFRPQAGTTEWARFTGGNFGIGTTTPSGKLEVNGTVYMPALGTSALGANMRVLIGGQVVESTSSLRYKTDVEDASDTISESVVYDSRPVWYRSLSEVDPDEWSFWGFIAEELHEIDPRLVSYKEDETGELVPDGVQYDRFVVHLVNVAQQQKARIDDLEARLAALEARL